MNEAAERDALASLAAEIGAQPTLIQAAGGNVSIKLGDVMWIKASGTWLANAKSAPIMAPLALDALLAAFARNDPACETCVDFLRVDLNPTALRPSIETTMHAVMPQKIVVHVHCVETIAWAVRVDAEAALTPRLAGLRWAFIPYIKPGLPLGQAMRRAARAGAEVIVLGNHGLVVAADNTDEARALLFEVVRRLRRPIRSAPPLNRVRLVARAEGSSYRIAADDVAHATATDPISLRQASGGSLFPDQVVFLGPGITQLEAGETVAQCEARSARMNPAGTNPALILVPGAGALLRSGASAATIALARCLGDVTARIGEDDTLHYLGAEAEAALLKWDAEVYRQSLNRSQS